MSITPRTAGGTGVRVVSIAVAAALLAEGALMATAMRSDTAAGWQAYIATTERRRARELSDRSRFLAMDFQADGADDRRAALAGGLPVRRGATVTSKGDEMTVPAAMVHHWRGAVFIRGATVADLIARLEFADPPAIQQDVLRSSVLSRSPGFVHVFLQLRRQKIVTVVYNTEHDVSFARYAAGRAASASTATRIAELSRPGTPAERELPPDEDRGFLWKLNSYWRYQDVAGGVLAECESVSLSRGVPAVLSYLVGGVIESTARESMESTLSAVRERYERAR